MITIGIGNFKGGVGSSTLCYQLAALIQRAGLGVAIAETSTCGADLHWCRGRSIREERILNCTMQSVGYLFVDDCVELRQAHHWVGYDYVLLDYSNARQDIESALRAVQHWVCPLGPIEFGPTLRAYELWCELHRRGTIAANTFSAVVNFAPGAEDIEDEPDWADPRFNGDHALEVFAREAPLLKVLQRRVRNNPALLETGDGRDVFSNSQPEAAEAVDDIEAVWAELLAHWKKEEAPRLPPSPTGIELPPRLDKFRRYMVGAPFNTRPPYR